MTEVNNKKDLIVVLSLVLLIVASMVTLRLVDSDAAIIMQLADYIL